MFRLSGPISMRTAEDGSVHQMQAHRWIGLRVLHCMCVCFVEAVACVGACLCVPMQKGAQACDCLRLSTCASAYLLICVCVCARVCVLSRRACVCVRTCIHERAHLCACVRAWVHAHAKA